MAANNVPPIRPWKVLGQTLLLSAPPWLSVYRERVQLPSTRIIDDFYRVVLPDFVAVLPVTGLGEILMVRGYKHGLGRETLTVPAGLMNPGERPLDAARRELLEETGYEAPQWTELGTYIVDGNRQCGTMHLFLARNARAIRPPQDDETEVLQLERMRCEQVLAALRAGEIATLAGAAAVALALVLGLGEPEAGAPAGEQASAPRESGR